MPAGTGSTDNDKPVKNLLTGSFYDLYDAFREQINEAHTKLGEATGAWEQSPTDPKLTLDMQARQGDLGNLSRGLGSLMSALIALQSEITQKIK